MFVSVCPFLVGMFERSECLQLDQRSYQRNSSAEWILSLVVGRICGAKLRFNVLLSERHLKPNCHFAFLNVP